MTRNLTKTRAIPPLMGNGISRHSTPCNTPYCVVHMVKMGHATGRKGRGKRRAKGRPKSVQRKLYGSMSTEILILPRRGAELSHWVIKACKGACRPAFSRNLKRYRSRMRAIGAGAGPNTRTCSCTGVLRARSVTKATPSCWSVADIMIAPSRHAKCTPIQNAC